jgi:hypothetical protein
MTKDDSREHWILTKWNVLFGVVCLIMIAVIGYTQYQRQGLERDNVKVSAQVDHWQSKLDKLVAKNRRVIYLPKAGDVNLTATQAKSVEWLSSFFTQITTFDNTTAYATNYRLAKRSVHDSQFYDTFMTAPVDNSGSSTVVATNLKLKNVRTQVIVTGSDTYQVVVTYIPYHAMSDLYQESSLTTLTQIFNVKGTAGNYSQMRIDNDMLPNGVTVKANSVE